MNRFVLHVNAILLPQHAAPLCAVVMLALLAGGCESKGPAAPLQKKGTAFASATREEFLTARLQAMAAADTYVSIIAQAADDLRNRATRPEVVEWAMEQRVATAMASFTSATH